MGRGLLLATLAFLALAVPQWADAAETPDCGKAQTTAALDACYGAAHKAADAALNARYGALMARLAADDQARLREAQRAWIAFRDKQCAFETAPYSTGTIYSMLVTICLTELTQARTGTFDHYLDCPEGDTSCVPLTATAQAPPAPARTPAPTPAADGSCRSAVGAAKAKTMVQQCLEVSPATHPPCNADNACSLISDEIRRGCAMIGNGAPAFCGEYR